MKIFKGLTVNKARRAELEKAIQDVLDNSLYFPLKDILRKSELLSEVYISALLSAIRSGRIYYRDGKLKGNFNSTISAEAKKLGLVWSNDGFKVNLREHPDIASAVGAKKDSNLLTIAGLLLFLSTINITTTTNIRIRFLIAVNEKIREINKETGANVPEVTDISPIVEDFMEHAEESINKFVDKRCADIVNKLKGLNEDVTPEDIEKIVQHEQDVTKSKSKFISDQALTMANTKITQQASEQLGYSSYMWVTKGDERVRPSRLYTGTPGENHRYLHMTIQRWDTPPITNLLTGHRAHPGMDWGCRCVARIIKE